MTKVVASISDGHTSLNTDTLPGCGDVFPVRMHEFSDGIFITGITPEYSKYIGTKVTGIGKLTAEEAFRRAGTLAFADN